MLWGSKKKPRSAAPVCPIGFCMYFIIVFPAYCNGAACSTTLYVARADSMLQSGCVDCLSVSGVILACTQLIQHLTAYSTEVCRWRLGLPSIVTSGTDGLSSSRAMPSVLRRGDYAGPVFHDEAVAERQSELSTDAMVETQCQSPRTFTLERRESPHTPPDMDKGMSAVLDMRCRPG